MSKIDFVEFGLGVCFIAMGIMAICIGIGIARRALGGGRMSKIDFVEFGLGFCFVALGVMTICIGIGHRGRHAP